MYNEVTGDDNTGGAGGTCPLPHGFLSSPMGTTEAAAILLPRSQPELLLLLWDLQGSSSDSTEWQTSRACPGHLGPQPRASTMYPKVLL